MDAPLFIVGANRSGTTLLRLMLNAHSRIAIPEELEYMRSSYEGLPVEQWSRPACSPAAYEAVVASFLDAAFARTGSSLDRAALQAEILNAPPSLRTPYAMFLRAWTHEQGKARWGEKTPGNLFFVDVLLEMFPDARFIHVVRDPRAGVASMQRVWFYTDDPVFNAMSRRTFAAYARTLLPKVVPPSQRMTLRYEDLVAHPEQALQTVCAFLDEPYEPEMLCFHRGAKQHMMSRAATSFNAAATTPVSAERAEAWRRHLSPTEVAQIEAICRAEMEAFGYSFDSPPLPWPAWMEIRVKALYWHVQVWRNRDVRGYMVRYPMFARLRHRLATAFARFSRAAPPPGTADRCG
jgi:hypothetical protein